jgi:hypothetical protein
MISSAQYLPSALGSATIPTELIVGPLHAWALLVALLVLSCVTLWILTKPLNNGSPTEWSRRRFGSPVHRTKVSASRRARSHALPRRA